MASGDDAGGDDAWRWARAQRQAERFPAPDVRPTLRRFLLVETPIVVVAGVGFTVAVAALVGPVHSRAVGWGMAISVLGLIALCVHHWVGHRPWSSNAMGVLTPEQRERVRAQIAGNAQVRQEDLPVLRAAARDRQAVQLRQAFLWPGLMLEVIAQTVISDGWIAPMLLMIAATVVVALGIAVAVRRYRRAAGFLRRYPEPDADRELV